MEFKLSFLFSCKSLTLSLESIGNLRETGVFFQEKKFSNSSSDSELFLGKDLLDELSRISLILSFSIDSVFVSADKGVVGILSSRFLCIFILR